MFFSEGFTICAAYDTSYLRILELDKEIVHKASFIRKKCGGTAEECVSSCYKHNFPYWELHTELKKAILATMFEFITTIGKAELASIKSCSTQPSVVFSWNALGPLLYLMM